MIRYTVRTDLLRRLAEWMQTRDLDSEGAGLLRETRAELDRRQGRRRALSSQQARDLIARHGSIQAAARASRGRWSARQIGYAARQEDAP